LKKFPRVFLIGPEQQTYIVPQDLEQKQIHPRQTCIPFTIVWQFHYTMARNCIFFNPDSLNYSKKGVAMFILAVLICLALLAIVSGDWYLSQFNADELSDMGVQKR
jgi:hypothetical protein